MHPFLENFRGFDERGELDVTRRNLPHWEQAGASYFVTMRLADSIPAPVRHEWDDDRRLWLSAHGVSAETLSTLPVEKQDEFRKRFSKRMHEYLDAGHGECLLKKPECQDIVSDSLRKFDRTRYHLGDFVIMPNHLHLLWMPMPGFGLGGLCKNFKHYTARQCHKALGRSGSFWQTESHDRIVRDGAELDAYRRYIHANPEKAKLREGEYMLYDIGTT